MLCVCVGGVMDVVFESQSVDLHVLVYGKCVSSCICCMFVSCVHPVAVLNTAFCFY